MRGAYNYLKDKPEMASVVEQCNIYEESFASKLEETGADMEGYTQAKSHRIQCQQMVDSLNVDSYSRLFMLNEDAAGMLLDQAQNSSGLPLMDKTVLLVTVEKVVSNMNILQRNMSMMRKAIALRKAITM